MSCLTPRRTAAHRPIVGAAILLAVLALAAPAALAAAGDTTLISRQSEADGGAGADGLSDGSRQMLSADGRYVVFSSSATNLSGADEDRFTDIFVRDTAAGTTILVSRRTAAKGGAAADGESFDPVISADGQFVGFQSMASNLDRKQGRGGLYLRDLEREKTALVARHAHFASLSRSGRYVAFLSERAGGPPEKAMVRDMKRGRSELVSRRSKGLGGARAKGNADAVSISANGRYVAFESPASNLSDKDNRGRDIFVRDINKGQTRLASLQSRSRGGKGADCCSENPAISPDGRYVVFESGASNLSPADTNHVDDVYLRDVKRRSTELVSRQGVADGGEVQDAGVDPNPAVLDLYPSVSAQGRYIAFHSTATNLSDIDHDGLRESLDIFLRDTAQRTTELVSRASDSAGGDPGNGDSFLPYISDDGRFVAFSSNAGNLSDADNPSAGFTDIFLRQYADRARRGDVKLVPESWSRIRFQPSPVASSSNASTRNGAVHLSWSIATQRRSR